VGGHPRRIVAVGDNVVDCYTSRGSMFPGGNCVNVSVYAARKGAQTAYVGAIAADEAGELIRSSLENEGVGTSRLRTIDGFTAYCRIGHVEGDRVFLDSAKGVSLFEPDADDLRFIAGFDAVHVGDSSYLDAHLGAFAARARLSYDFSDKTDRGLIEAIAPHCFLASFSGSGLTDAEAAALAGLASTAGAQWVLVTRGKYGAMLTDGETTWSTEAMPATVVDTLGAGDTFIARTLLGLLDAEHPDTALAEAALAAAETCAQHGAFGYGAPIRIAAPDEPAVRIP